MKKYLVLTFSLFLCFFNLYAQKYKISTPPYSPQYTLGGGVGAAFGQSTFTSFAKSGIKVGKGAHLSLGFQLSQLYSAELSVGYTSMALGMSGCCEGLYYANGKRFFAPVAGVASYGYHDLNAVTNLWTITASVQIDLLHLWVEQSQWQLLLQPNIGIALSDAELQYTHSTIAREENTHLIVGGALGVAYWIDDSWGLRLASGVDYLAGGAFDAVPQCEHTNGYIWSTTMSLLYKGDF